jgi:hypothetical protein
MGREKLLVCMAGVLAAPIRMMHQTPCRLPLPQCHAQYLLHHGCIDVWNRRPSHDFARISIQECGDI